jgi:hypothetical protein
MKRCFITFHFTTFNLAPDLIAIYPGADPGRGRIQGGATGAPTPKIGKKYDFSHEIPQKCSRLLRSAQFF